MKSDQLCHEAICIPQTARSESLRMPPQFKEFKEICQLGNASLGNASGEFLYWLPHPTATFTPSCFIYFEGTSHALPAVSGVRDEFNPTTSVENILIFDFIDIDPISSFDAKSITYGRERNYPYSLTLVTVVTGTERYSN